MNSHDFSKWFKERYKRTSSFYLGVALMVIDCIGIMLCFGAAFFIVNLIDHSLINFKSFVTYWIYLPAFLAVFYIGGLYPGIMLPPGDEVRRFGACSFCCFAGIAMSIVVEQDDKVALTAALLLAIPIAVVLLPMLRELARKRFSRRNFWGIPAVLYCDTTIIPLILEKLKQKPEYGYRIVAVINTGSLNIPDFFMDIPVLSADKQTLELIRSLKIKVAIVTESSDPEFKNPDMRMIQNSYRYTISIPAKYSIQNVAFSVRDFGGIIGLATTHNLSKGFNLFIKRVIDLGICLIFSPFILIVMLILGLCVKFTSPGQVFFGHKRIGKNGKTITTWKFRSMVVDAETQLKKLLAENPALKEEWDANQKLEHDPRITKFGAFLRKTSLDELPQLWNVFIGDMSLVGPRPIVSAELEKYGEASDYVFSVKPGLSGLWQVSGRSETNYAERVLLDSYYIQNWSIWLDIWILIRTMWVVLNGKGAY